MAKNFCGQCGARVTPEQRFCERCGTPLRGAEPPPAKEIPKTRLGMKRPASLPTAPMPPDAVPGPQPQPRPRPSPPPALPSADAFDFDLPRRRRRWPWVVLGLVVLFVGSAAGGWFGAPLITHGLVARYGLPTGDGEAEVAAALVDGAEPEMRIQLASLGAAPAGVTLATPVYDIEPRGDAAGPFEVSLPLLDPGDGRRAIVGHYHDGAWQPLATEVRDGRAIAVTDSFSRFAGFYPEEISPAELRDEARRARLHVNPPRVVYGEVSPEGPVVVFDLRGSNFAFERRPWGRMVTVPRLRLELNRPAPGRPQPSPGSFEDARAGGEPIVWETSAGTGRLGIPLAPLESRYDSYSTVTDRRWELRVVPLYDDGSAGPPSEPVAFYPEVLVAYAYMNRQAPFGDAARATFDQRVAARPLRVVYGGYFRVRDAYNGSLASSARRRWGSLFGGVSGPHIGLTTSATYGGVVTHEWGHYAAHMALGDAYEQSSPAGPHNGWVESSRGLAFTEDLATFLGQWATGRGGVPAPAGAMFGHVRDMSRHPEGEGTLWPRSRDMDAPAVETVPATVLSRLALATSFADVFAIIAADPPRDLLAFVDAAGDAHRERLQPILMDEGVSWRVEGRVVEVTEDGALPQPVEGATIHVRTLDGVELFPHVDDSNDLQPATLADGRFVVRVPPGPVQIVAEKAGLAQREPVQLTVDTTGPTNGEPAALEGDLEMERGLEVVIESPVDGATVDERILVVSGRVELAEGASLETVTLSTASGEVQAPVSGGRFEGRVTLTPGENTVTASASQGEAEATASVTVDAEIDATVLMCELTWTRNGTDVDLWVTDPEGVTTGFTNRRPREGRLLDVDNTRGFGPETYTMSRPIAGEYQIRVNYYRGAGPVGFRVRWCAHEATPRQQCSERSGTLAEANHNGQGPSGNHRFTVTVPR